MNRLESAFNDAVETMPAAGTVVRGLSAAALLALAACYRDDGVSPKDDTLDTAAETDTDTDTDTDSDSDSDTDTDTDTDSDSDTDTDTDADTDTDPSFDTVSDKASCEALLENVMPNNVSTEKFVLSDEAQSTYVGDDFTDFNYMLGEGAAPSEVYACVYNEAGTAAETTSVNWVVDASEDRNGDGLIDENDAASRMTVEAQNIPLAGQVLSMRFYDAATMLYFAESSEDTSVTWMFQVQEGEDVTDLQF